MPVSPAELKKLLKGRTPEQQSAIKYFVGGGGGCLSTFSKGISDEQYESMVMAKAKETDFKKKALDKLGVDESQVNEIEPVHFEDYTFDDKNSYARWGKDKIWRGSDYQISWIFFSSTQVYVYQNTFSMVDDRRKEKTEEYFYKDITNFSSTSDSVEKEVLEKTGCKGEPTFSRKVIDSNKFALVVPGEKFICSMEKSDYTEKAIQGMKAKLREKKT